MTITACQVVTLLAVLLASMARAATPTVKDLESRQIHPYTSDCVHFRLAAHRGNSKFSKGIIGFVTSVNSHLYLGSSADATVFHFGRYGGLRNGIHKYWVAASRHSYDRGYGPLVELERNEDGLAPEKRRVWEVGQKNALEYMNRAFTVNDGFAEFCYRSDNSQLYGEFTTPVPSKIKCKPVTFVLQCVDIPPHPSDLSSLDELTSFSERETNFRDDNLEWKAARRRTYN